VGTPFPHNKEEEEKSNKRLMAGTIPGETKRETQRKAKRSTASRAQKEGES
jgi:hypothetical protein